MAQIEPKELAQALRGQPSKDPAVNEFAAILQEELSRQSTQVYLACRVFCPMNKAEQPIEPCQTCPHFESIEHNKIDDFRLYVDCHYPISFFC